MIAKAPAAPAARRRRNKNEALDVELTVRFNFGEDEADHVTVMDGRRVPMVGSVLANRDRILRSFVQLLLRTAVRQPRVARELFPWVKIRNKKTRR